MDPANSPNIEPNAIFIIFLKLFLSSKYAPKNAPKNGPIIKAKGTGVKTPKINPIKVPLIAFCLPPNFFTPYICS